MTRVLTISKKGRSYFEADDKSLPGSPAVGRGRSINEAVGSWVHQNRKLLDVELVFNEIDLDKMKKSEQGRRRRLMRSR